MKHPAAEAFTVHNHPNQLLDAAREMISRERYEVSVVTAQMACEICTERVLRVYFRAKKVGFLEESVEELLPSYNLANDKVRRVYIALTDDFIHKQFFWAEYKTMVSIRNKAVHSGARVQESQAQMVARIASSVVKHLQAIELLASKSLTNNSN